ncbi:MAG: transposase domain-containing protein, partial [Culicoidibacterales bacterium]
MTEMEKHLKEQNKQLMKHIDQLTEQIAVMNQRFFGRKSEKCIPENQTSLFDDHLTPEESV